MPLKKKILEDATLIDLCIQGSRVHREELAKACIPAVRKIVLLGYGNRPDTEDVVQHVLTTLFRDLDNLKNPAAFKPWMYRVACNAIYSHGSKRAKLNALFFYDADMDTRPSIQKEDSPEERTAKAQMFGKISTHLEKIAHKKRMAVVLSLFFGYVDSEIGAIVGCATETAKKRVQNGRRELIKLIQKDSHLRELMEEAI